MFALCYCYTTAALLLHHSSSSSSKAAKQQDLLRPWASLRGICGYFKQTAAVNGGNKRDAMHPIALWMTLASIGQLKGHTYLLRSAAVHQ